MIITGTSLHDLPRTIVGYEMCANAANPNGAAAAISREHWKYAVKSALVRLPDRRLDRWDFE